MQGKGEITKNLNNGDTSDSNACINNATTATRFRNSSDFERPTEKAFQIQPHQVNRAFRPPDSHWL